MINVNYSNAMSEVLYYLNGINQESINKIPKKFINFLEENASKNYKCNFDYTKPLKDLDLLNETRGLIAMICLNYWCETDEQKKAFVSRLNENELKYQEELRKLYNPDDLFKNNRISKNDYEDFETTSKNTELIEYKKESFITKIFNKLKKLFTN